MGSRPWIFSAAATASLALAAYGGFLLATNGLPGRFGDEPLRLAGAKDDMWRPGACVNTICRVGPPAGPESFVLWGDSHAHALAPAVEQVALANHLSGLVAAGNGCAPFPDLHRYDPGDRGSAVCPVFNDAVLARIDAHHIRNVFLHARWALYVEGDRYKEENGSPAVITPSRRTVDNAGAFEDLLRKTLRTLKERQLNVVIIASVPEVGLNVPSVLARQAHSGATVDLAPRYDEFMARQTRAFAILQRVAREFTVPVEYPHETLCNLDRCAVVKDGYPLYMDNHHLSVHGARYLTPMFARLLSAR